MWNMRLPGLVNDVEQHVAQREVLAVNEFLDAAMADKVASLFVGIDKEDGRFAGREIDRGGGKIFYKKS